MTHDEKLKLLDSYSRFLEKLGYLDSDWYAEEPTAIERFLEYEFAQQHIKRQIV